MSRPIWDDVSREIQEFRAGIRELPVTTPAHPETIRRDIESAFDLRAPIPLPELTQKVVALLRSYTVQVTHPRYFGLFNPSVSEAGIVADTLAALYNLQLAAWSHAPAANELEHLTLAHLGRALGFDPAVTFANFTTGGLESTLSAILAALAHRFPDVAVKGTSALAARPVIYVTSESHHSVLKVARMSGLGTDVLSEVPTTSRFALDVSRLTDQIRRDTDAGRCPFMVVGTAGTTGGGVVDPLPALADIAAECHAWFHVDAAWGGAAALVPRLRATLDGIERADSVTWDAHKWLSVPMGAGMFFCRHPAAVRAAFDVSTSYMPSATGVDMVDPYLTTVQWSRRAIGLKVFMSLAERGRDGFAEQIDHQARMGDLLRAKLSAAGWVIANDTPLPLICFTHEDIRSKHLTTGEILKTIYSRGRVWISDVVLGRNERVLRACITSFRTEEADLDDLIRELEFARIGE